jgi:hypothetical protein
LAEKASATAETEIEAEAEVIPSEQIIPEAQAESAEEVIDIADGSKEA